MSEAMTSYERIRAALLGEETDRIPVSPFPAYVWEFFPEEIRKKGHLAFYRDIGADPMWRGAPCPVKCIHPELENREYEENGYTYRETITPVGTLRHSHMKSAEGNTNFLVEHPLKTEDDWKTFLWIEEQKTYEPNPEPVSDHFKGDGKEGLSIGMLIPRAKSAFQHLVEHQAGTEELIYALMDFPETVETVWKQMVENDLKAVRIAAESEYEFFITWEDSSTQNYSPLQYDTYIGSEIGQWCDILKQSGKYYIQHACGHVKDLAYRMRDHGVLAIESISPPPTGNISIRDARAAVGNDFGIIGGIEPTAFLNKTEEELPSYVESVIEEGQGGPFVLANSDSCPPGVTPEKYRIVCETAKKVRN